MTTLLIASGNAGKLVEFQSLLSKSFRVLGTRSPEVASFKSPNVIEDADSYFENGLKKAIAFQKIFQMPVLSDDSGLEVDLLEGRPGVHSAIYGGDKISSEKRCELILSELSGTAPEKWTARFRCVLCFFDGVHVPQFFQGVTEGILVQNPRGNKGFGYDPIFFSRELGRTFAEADTAQKDLVSHRGRAVRHFLKWRENRHANA